MRRARSGSASIRGRRSGPRQVDAAQNRDETGIRREGRWIQRRIGRKRRAALRRIVEARIAHEHWNSVCIEARRVECGIDDSEVIVLGEKCLLVHCSGFHVVNALHVRHTRASARIRQGAILAYGLLLEVRGPEIGEGIAAWIIVVRVAPHVKARGQHGVGTDQVIPSWRDVECADFGALIRGTNHVAVRIESAVRHHDAIPWRGILRVERIRRLKPGTGVAHVQMQRV